MLKFEYYSDRNGENDIDTKCETHFGLSLNDDNSIYILQIFWQKKSIVIGKSVRNLLFYIFYLKSSRFMSIW